MSGEVGKVYADALYALCLEEDTLEPVYAELNACAQVFSEHPELIRLLNVTTIPIAEKISIGDRLFSENAMLHNLISMLITRGRISYIGEIAAAFNQSYNTQHQIAEMTVTTSVPLTDTLRQRLLAKLSEKSGKTVRLSECVDASILGGVVVQYGNTLIDNSVKTRLEAVKKQLKQ